jgi:hypothetical protein
VTLTSEQFEYLMGEATATIEACRKKYDFTSGLVLENEWIVQLDGGRFVIHDKARNKNLRYSSLDQGDVQEAVDTIVRALNK